MSNVNSSSLALGVLDPREVAAVIRAWQAGEVSSERARWLTDTMEDLELYRLAVTHKVEILMAMDRHERQVVERAREIDDAVGQLVGIGLSPDDDMLDLLEDYVFGTYGVMDVRAQLIKRMRATSEQEPVNPMYRQ